MTLKVGSLFSGYGGLDLAVTNVIDAEVVWHCEYDEAPSKILEAHYPGIPNYGDVTKIDFAAIDQVDILTGGFPCQDLSTAGKRAGLKDGTRSGLWSYFLKAIEIQKPKLVVIENVRGLLSAEATIYSDLEPGKWGRFTAAIHRWEMITNTTSPDPTKPNAKDGSHRLSEHFVEWLMGLPQGWITGVGLTRNEALKACGNGVVPQQAELALRLLLEITPVKGINK